MASRKPSRRGTNTTRDFPRTLRLNALLREILADELELIEDERLALLTVVSVEVEADLRRAVVYYDHLDGDDGDEEALASLGEWRIRLQGAIGRQARTKRVPELSFKPDQSIRNAARIDAILSRIQPSAAPLGESVQPAGSVPSTESVQSAEDDAATDDDDQP
jgi:ribosome-binding factor A